MNESMVDFAIYKLRFNKLRSIEISTCHGLFLLIEIIDVSLVAREH